MMTTPDDVELRILPVTVPGELPTRLLRRSVVLRTRIASDLIDPELIISLGLTPAEPFDRLVFQSMDRRRSAVRWRARQEPPSNLSAARATWLDASDTSDITALLTDHGSPEAAARMIVTSRASIMRARSEARSLSEVAPKTIVTLPLGALRAHQPQAPERTALYPSDDDRAVLIGSWNSRRLRDRAIAEEEDVDLRWLPWTPENVALVVRACAQRFSERTVTASGPAELDSSEVGAILFDLL